MNKKIKKSRIYTFKGDGVNTCRCCEFPLKKSPYFESCSAECAKEIAELKSIPLPTAFVISLVNRTKNVYERELQLRNYISRHNLDETKAFSRFKEIVNKMKKEGIDSIRRKACVY